MVKLLTIGDSISQGFMSAGAARTDLCYSTLLAECLGLDIDRDYHYLKWPMGGIPLNMEVLLRNLSRYYGGDIWGPFEWGSAAIRISSFIDRLEDYYERGKGDYRRAGQIDINKHHNLASFGFTISDAWQLTPRKCLKKLEPNGRRPIDDEMFSTPSDSFYRSAFRVLNPNFTGEDAREMDFSQIKWIEHFAQKEGIENLVVWLGANNALGTVLHLEIKEAKDPNVYEKLTHFERTEYNLLSAACFEQDYTHLLDEIVNAVGQNNRVHCNIFIATVPPVTVAPIIKGIKPFSYRDDPFEVVDKARYYDKYAYFLFDKISGFGGSVPFLSLENAYYIDSRISDYSLPTLVFSGMNYAVIFTISNFSTIKVLNSSICLSV